MIIFNKVKNFFLDIFFPVECLGCGKEGSWLCEDCFEKVELSQSQFCPVCCKPNKTGFPCEDCAGQSFLDKLIVCVDYNNPIISQSIKDLKYRYLEDLGLFLGDLMAKFVKTKKTVSDSSSFLITTVPLHWKRNLERNFNQSNLIANRFCECLNLNKPIDILKRMRYTVYQASLKRKERFENIKNCFVCLKLDLIKDKKIIIIDDVFTTGATLQECAKTLKHNGAKEVVGLVIAHES
jgi:ComF family protein